MLAVCAGAFVARVGLAACAFACLSCSEANETPTEQGSPGARALGPAAGGTTAPASGNPGGPAASSSAAGSGSPQSPMTPQSAGTVIVVPPVATTDIAAEPVTSTAASATSLPEVGEPPKTPGADPQPVASSEGTPPQPAATATPMPPEASATLAGALPLENAFNVRAECEEVVWEQHTYALCRDQGKPWPVARKDCEDMGMQLIRLDTKEESDWIYETFYSEKVGSIAMWTGATDRGVEGEWRWLIGDTLFWKGKADGEAQNGRYAHWGRAHGSGPEPTQPNDSHEEAGEDCMVIRDPKDGETGHWTDVGCGPENNPPASSRTAAWTCEAY